MRFCSIASGSSGNCIYIEGSGTHILVDAGISMKRIISGLSNLGVEPTDLDAILITHEHSDHVGGVEVLVNKYQIPIYSTEETLGVVREKDKRKRLDPVLFHPIVPDTPFHIKNMEITPFSTSHDARNPVCYTVKAEGHKVGVATDLGTYDDYIISHLAGSEILLLEANHDIAMLQVGPYPYALKKRVLGERGHLSNDHSARLILELLHEGLQYVMLGHLSKENNYPELAYETIRYELNQQTSDTPFFELRVAGRDEPSDLVVI